MSNINLLPWRAQQAATQKKQFIVQLCLVCLFSIALVMLAYSYIKLQVREQQQHNKAARVVSEQLNSTLETIEQFRQYQHRLQHRVDIIEQLQQDRGLPVQLFNQLPKWVPANVHLEQVHYSNHALIIKGKAQTHRALARMVEQIEHSPWLLAPKLTVSKAGDEAALPAHPFLLQLEVKKPRR